MQVSESECIVFPPLAICCNPVYVYPHSKCVLMQAILADTEFLAQNAIMDYSLLTCIDDSTGELVVGIIGTYVCMRGGGACMWLV